MMTVLIVLIGCGFAAVLVVLALHVLGMIDHYLPEDEPQPTRSCPPCDHLCHQGRYCPAREENV